MRLFTVIVGRESQCIERMTRLGHSIGCAKIIRTQRCLIGVSLVARTLFGLAHRGLGRHLDSQIGEDSSAYYGAQNERDPSLD